MGTVQISFLSNMRGLVDFLVINAVSAISQPMAVKTIRKNRMRIFLITAER